MLKSQVFQYYTEKLWEKIKTTFMSKNDAINGVILDYKWKLVKSSINDVSIFLPSLDEIDEIYIEMSSPDSVILHQVTVKKDGLIPVGSNATSKEILLDGVFDYQTYVTYDVATNKITPSVFGGATIDRTTSVTTSVYVKEHIESDITVPAGSIAYDNVTSGMVSEDVQGAIDELKSDVSNITLDAEHTSYDNSTSGLSATNVQGAIDENVSIGNQALAIAKGRNQSLAYNTYSEMVTALNGMTKDELKRGQNIYIGTVGVPDLWVYSVETTKSTYTYTNDETFVNGLNNNVTVKVGYYKLAQLETQKVDVGGINSAIDTLQSDVGTLQNNLNNLSATNVSVDDTTLALGGSNVQDTLEALKSAISTTINSTMGWKLVGSATDINRINYPSEFKELKVITNYSTAALFSRVISKEELDIKFSTSTNTHMMLSDVKDSVNYANWEIYSSYLLLSFLAIGGSDKTYNSGATTYLYYR